METILQKILLLSIHLAMHHLISKILFPPLSKTECIQLQKQGR